MKVRVGNKIYNSDEEPILLVLSNVDKMKIRLLPKQVLTLYPHTWEKDDPGEALEV